MSSLNDFFIHSMVHPDVTAAYLEGKPVPPALLINEVPETSAAPVVAEIVSSVNDGEWIIFKVSNTNVPTTPVVTRLHDPSEPSGPSDPSQPSISEFIVFGRILSSYNGWTMIYTTESRPYLDPTSIANSGSSGKKSGQKHGTINSDPDPDPSEFPLDIHDLLFVRSGDLKQSSKEISIYFYNTDAPISGFPTDPINNDPSVLKSPNTIMPDMTEFWNQFNPEYLGEIGIADILKFPTITIRNIEIDPYLEGVIVEVDIYDPDWVFMIMSSDPGFVISMPDPDTSGNIITGICMDYNLINSSDIQDFIETHTINSTFDILFRNIYWNYDNESAPHKYWLADMTTMSYKAVWGHGLDGYIIESNVMNFTYKIPRFSVDSFQYENNLNINAYVAPHKFGIENAENIPDDIEITLQYREKGTEEWIDAGNTGEWEYYPANPEIPDSWDEWDYNMTIDISSILASMGDNESKLYNLRGVITINGQTEESESEFVITTEVQEQL